MQNNDQFDPAKFRLDQDFDKRAGTQKLLTVVPVRRPSRFEFVRVHPDTQMCLEPAAIIVVPDTRETYLVSSEMFGVLGQDVKLVALFTATTRQGTTFLWPVNLPSDGRSNQWNESALEAAHTARTQWVRVASNSDLGAYELILPHVALPEPEWPPVRFHRLLEIAFKGRVIDDTDHPILRRLRGDV